MTTQKGDGCLSTSSLIEIVTDAVAMTTNMTANMNMTTSSHSLSSRADSDEAGNCGFPLRRVGSFPVNPAAPPRRPSRSTSLERQQESCRSLGLDSEEDEIDHQKFRRLLLGNQVGETDNSAEVEERKLLQLANLASELETDIAPPMISLRERKSSCSAPPKIPHRVGSDSESVTARQASASTLPPETSLGRITRERKKHRQSLPSTVFRPRAVHRRRRQRSFIQEMLTPDSEGSSKSLRLPPKLPSRSESEKSIEGRPSNASTIPSSVFCSAASSATVGSSQKSTGSTDAPKRPRRSLSPIYGESIRSLMDANTCAANMRETEPDQKIAAGEVLLSSSPIAPPRIRRKVPTRAKTFSFHEDSIGSPKKGVSSVNNSCIAMLSKNWDVGRDFTGSPIKSDSEWTSTTWPKPRRTKVAPGRSRTFSFFVKPSNFAASHGLVGDADSSSVLSRCA